MSTGALGPSCGCPPRLIRRPVVRSSCHRAGISATVSRRRCETRAGLPGSHLPPFLLAVFHDTTRPGGVVVVAELVTGGHRLERIVDDPVSPGKYGFAVRQ